MVVQRCLDLGFNLCGIIPVPSTLSGHKSWTSKTIGARFKKEIHFAGSAAVDAGVSPRSPRALRSGRARVVPAPHHRRRVAGQLRAQLLATRARSVRARRALSSPAESGDVADAAHPVDDLLGRQLLRVRRRCRDRWCEPALIQEHVVLHVVVAAPWCLAFDLVDQ